jgi:hypothetical protein
MLQPEMASLSEAQGYRHLAPRFIKNGAIARCHSRALNGRFKVR